MIVAAQRRTPAPAGAWRPFVPKRPRSWGPDVVLLCATIAWTVPLAWPSPLVDLDIAVRDVVDANRPPWAEQAAIITNMFGQGGLLGTLALVIAAVLAWRHRTARPLLAFLVAYGSAGAVLVLKDVLPRVYPHWPRPEPGAYADATEAVLFTALEPSGAYPSGHVLNTIIWYGFIIVMIGARFTGWQRGLMRFFPPVVVILSTTYLGFHWFSDTPAGLFIGLIILRLVQRIPWDTVELPTWLEPERRYF